MAGAMKARAPALMMMTGGIMIAPALMMMTGGRTRAPALSIFISSTIDSISPGRPNLRLK